MCNRLLGPSILDLFNKKGELFADEYLQKTIKSVALLAALTCRPCQVHYKQINAVYVPYMKAYNHRLVTPLIFWKDEDIKCFHEFLFKQKE